MTDQMTGLDADVIAEAVAKASTYIARMGSATPWEALRNCGIPRESLTGDEDAGPVEFGVVIAVGLSPLAAEILIGLHDRHVAEPVPLLVYLMEGDPIPVGMPLAKRPPRGGYKRAHFAPMVWTSGLMPERLSC